VQCHHLLSQCIAFLLLLLFLLQQILEHKTSIGDNKNSNITLLLPIKWSHLLMDGFIILKHINFICCKYTNKLKVLCYRKEEIIQLVHKVNLIPSCECGGTDKYFRSFPHSQSRQRCSLPPSLN
jgi:hypothetical protein